MSDQSDVQITWHTREEAALWPEGIVVLMFRDTPRRYDIQQYWRPNWCIEHYSHITKFARLDTTEYLSNE